MRQATALLLALILAVPLFAQSGDWDRLRTLRPGERIWVDYADGHSLRSASAEMAAWTTGALRIRRGSREIEIARGDVRKVSVYAGKSHARGTAIGALIGGATGAGVFGALAARTGSDMPPVAALAAGAGAVFAIVGAIVGAVVGKTKRAVWYESR